MVLLQCVRVDIDTTAYQLPLVSRFHPDMGRHMSSLVSPPTTPGLLSIHSLDPFSGDTYFDFGTPAMARASLGLDVHDVIDEELKIGLRECQIDSDRLIIQEVIGQGE